ncbi:MAG TPA: Bax inhibitor-1/YccA family protein [Mycobacteriales bacterium]|nr:Bax inhibitor-1/YccA family protein [Mycobacteriales bacterium]
MESSNPVFGNAPTLKAPTPSVGELEEIYRTPQRLTMDDVVIKTGLLLSVVLVAGGLTWAADLGFGVVAIAGLVGFALAMVNTFKKQVSPGLVLAYAACEGVFLGGISKVYETAYNGIVVQAAIGTSALFLGVLWAYKSGRLRATPKFTKMVVGAGFGVLGLMVVNLLASVIGGGDGLGLRSGGGIAILFSLACIGIASLFFVLDFDQAERLVAAGVPERESWRVAFGLLVTLVWLYLEVLRLLSYLRD